MSSSTTAAESAKTKTESVVKQAAVHRASKLAASTKEAQKSTSPSAFVQTARAVIELEMLALQAQLALLKDLESMSDDEKRAALFTVLDVNRDGKLSTVELAAGIRRVRADVDFEESIALALERVAYFDKDGNAQLDLAEFKDYTDTLCQALGTTFHEMSEMLIFSILFSPSDDMEDFVSALVDEDITAALQQEEALTKVMADERMKLLFHVFDLDADGTVDFKEVVTGLYKYTHNLEESSATAVAALLLFDDDGNRTLDYAEFTKFILQLVAEAGGSFDDAILSLTMLASEPADLTPEEIMDKVKAMVAADA